MQLTRLDAGISPVIYCVSQSEKRGGKRHKIYADTFEKFRSAGTSQLLGHVRKFVWEWEP